MESEEAVTKIIVEREILKKKSSGFVSNPNYNLGKFLQNVPYEPNRFDNRFVFIK